MPTTRKKVTKAKSYKDENDSEPEESGDFSDSGSDAKITDVSSSEDEEQAVSSGEEFEDEDPKSSKPKKAAPRRRPQFAKNFIKKIRDEPPDDLGENSAATKAFSGKDLTDADKLLPSFLNLSESDSSDDESPRKPASIPTNTTFSSANDADSDHETKMEYQDVWSKNIPDNSEEIAQKTFKELEIHKTKIEETKASILTYTAKNSSQAFDVKDLLAQGEEVLPDPTEVKKPKKKKKQNDSDSEMEDWEEVKESKPLPASGLQVVVDFPDAVHRKSKKLDVEMMMRRKMNRVRKEYQVYMHKVHVLCWLGHGNDVSSILNDQEIMSAVLTLVPSKECYPGERVDVKYVEQITKWFKNKMTLVQDKHENKFKPKSPPLKDILLKEIKNKTVSTKKFMFFIFVSMLRALGLQCRVMFNFVTLPIRPPSSELCSLSTKEKEEKQNAEPKKEDTKKSAQKKSCKSKKKSKQIPQVDGNYDSDMDVDDIYFSDTNIMQVDGNDDGNIVAKSRKTKRSKASIAIEPTEKDEDVSPPKRARRAANPLNSEPSKSVSQDKILPKKRNRKASEEKSKAQETKPVKVDKNKASPASKTLSLNRRGKTIKETEPKESKNDISTTLQENSSKKDTTAKQTDPPKIIVTNENNKAVSTKFFESNSSAESIAIEPTEKDEDVSPPKRARRAANPLNSEPSKSVSQDKILPKKRNRKASEEKSKAQETKPVKVDKNKASPASKTLSLNRRGKTIKETEPKESKNDISTTLQENSSKKDTTAKQTDPPKIIVTNENNKAVSTKFFESNSSAESIAIEPTEKDEDVSPPKRARSAANPLNSEPSKSVSQDKILPKKRNRKASEEKSKARETKPVKVDKNKASPASKTLSLNRRGKTIKETDPPKIIVTNENNKAVSTKFFESNSSAESSKSATRSRSKTADVKNVLNAKDSVNKNTKSRSKSAGTSETSKYFNDSAKTPTKIVPKRTKKTVRDPDDELRVSHRDLAPKIKTSPKNDVASTLIAIMKDILSSILEKSMNNVKAIKKKTKTVKGKSKTKGDSDYEPEAASDDDFKPTKISPKPSGSRKIDRRVLSTDDEAPRDKTDVWCEVFVEELEQWIAVDVVKGQVHCTNEIYSRATHPVCYVVGWDNNNYLKDLTRRYVPHWNTVTRKQRAEPVWWDTVISPWKGPRTPRDREEDEALDRMQLDAPLPKSIAEYKNHPLYALKRHLLKYEALYPPDAATLGFVRGEAVYARDCVYICRSRDTWLKEAKVVRLGEKPYKVVKARPKWDKLSNKLITDKPLEIFGPWQVQDYEPPVAENGVVPRNAYGNVELFKACMLPKGTVHIKLPGLNKVAKKLNIDCAPAMTGFNGGWSYPVYDGFVVCQEFEEVITQAWLEDQVEMERREKEKTEARV
ncbi:DNA repair protein complementing XP-C cells homolog [Leguminivora glycinivorella]|uniref:DNA repair protein complementing XP-C cells homolog n=1 Tax=Leguminivora glycinivorella TaxID=1035111 RepID=UPI00200C4CA6|nr:DNA repair protein complementing XP-C cells homolog [Leguminivora glycinivorella]